MIEFDDMMTTVLEGKDAIKQRVQKRLLHTTEDIPYYSRGVDLTEFTFGSKSIALRTALKDFGANVIYDDKNSRVQLYNIIINVDKVGE